MLFFCGTYHVSQYIANSPTSCCTVRSACTTYTRESDQLNSFDGPKWNLGKLNSRRLLVSGVTHGLLAAYATVGSLLAALLARCFSLLVASPASSRHVKRVTAAILSSRRLRPLRQLVSRCEFDGVGGVHRHRRTGSASGDGLAASFSFGGGRDFPATPHWFTLISRH